MTDTIVLHTLQSAGLSDKQSRVYTALLEHGALGVSAIAEAAGIKRTITYVVLDELQAKGFATRVSGARKNLFAAVDPNAIASELEKTTREFVEMLPIMRGLQNTSAKPFITFYTGPLGAKHAFEQIRKPKVARFALSIATAELYIPEEVARWRRLYELKKVRGGSKHLLTESPQDRDYATLLRAAGQEVRFLPKNTAFDIDFVLADNRVYLTSFQDSVQVSVVDQIGFYQTLCTIFDLAWSVSTKK